MERVLEIGTKKHTKVVCMDEPGPGGACHEYQVLEAGCDMGYYADVHFQNGPIKENGVNGCHNEDLIAIVIDRLEHFQKTAFKCVYNEVAIQCLEDALASLKKRTDDREARGVEGTSII